ncbi:MAG: hypothetical protein E5W98_20560 [Mesorhizobium sp.]|nr:MAG: hypothetical protein E5W98_20560 [Mesorhizobium sp.]
MNATNVVHLSNQRPKRAHPADDLSFMGLRPEGGINYWTIKGSRNYTEDCETGAILADEYLVYIGAHPTNFNAVLLTSIVEDMQRAGELGGVEIGFLNGVNRAALFVAATKPEYFERSKAERESGRELIEKRHDSPFHVIAFTDCIGGAVMERHYRSEEILVDPGGRLDEPCLVVFKFRGGDAYLATCEPTRHAEDGRFARKGESHVLLNGCIRLNLKDVKCIRVLGRVVGDRRPPIRERELSAPVVEFSRSAKETAE